MTRHLALLAAATFSVHAAIAQFVPPDPSGFQGLLVETYYVADSVDASDLDGSSMDELNEGAVTLGYNPRARNWLTTIAPRCGK